LSQMPASEEYFPPKRARIIVIISRNNLAIIITLNACKSYHIHLIHTSA
jgi:hypothetical protein